MLRQIIRGTVIHRGGGGEMRDRWEATDIVWQSKERVISFTTLSGYAVVMQYGKKDTICVSTKPS